MNVELLKEIRDEISQHPSAFDQGTFGTTDHRSEDEKYPALFVNPFSCGGACCIAGWAVFLSGKHQQGEKMWWYDEDVGAVSFSEDDTIVGHAASALDISRPERSLLFSSTWPYRWVENINDGVPLETYSSPLLAGFFPTPNEAVGILDHLIEFGFEQPGEQQ